MKSIAWVLLLASAMPLAAQKPAPLPDFTVVAPNGNAVASDRLRVPRQWVLVYVLARSARSEAVLEQLREERPGRLAAKTMVIVGGAGVAEARALLSRYRHLRNVTWYADPDLEALQKLRIPGVPAVLGMREGIAEWRFVGQTANSRDLKALLKDWREK